MMRSIWSGSVSFGLVNIPITLHPATKSKSLSFRLLNKKDNHPVKYLKVDEVEDIALAQEDIVKGYEFEKGQFVVLSDQDFEAAEIKTGRTIEITDFVSLNQIDPIFFQKTYYLAPTESSKKAYKILERSLESEQKAAVAKVVIRNKQNLVVVRPKDGSLVMETMFYSGEIHLPSQINEVLENIEVSEAEQKMAQDLIKAMAGTFEPQKYNDDYRQNLLNIIEEKIKGRQISVPEIPEAAPVIDIMSALKESMEKFEREKKPAEKKRKTA